MKLVTDENGKTHTKFRGNDMFQGYKGILHGGIITTLLDATIIHYLFSQGVIALICAEIIYGLTKTRA